MFTGIVEQVGKIKEITGNIFTVLHVFEEPFYKGESIALSGMCTTIIDFTENTFSVEIMEESRNKTIFGNITVGDSINLERSARMDQRNSGHMVSGHIDETGTLLSITAIEDFVCFRIGYSKLNEKFLVPKGSIALDGISLTLSGISAIKEKNPWFEVSIISHTLKNTTLGTAQVGDSMNLEFDLFGKYVYRQTQITTNV